MAERRTDSRTAGSTGDAERLDEQLLAEARAKGRKDTDGAPARDAAGLADRAGKQDSTWGTPGTTRHDGTGAADHVASKHDQAPATDETATLGADTAEPLHDLTPPDFLGTGPTAPAAAGPDSSSPSVVGAPMTEPLPADIDDGSSPDPDGLLSAPTGSGQTEREVDLDPGVEQADRPPLLVDEPDAALEDLDRIHGLGILGSETPPHLDGSTTEPAAWGDHTPGGGRTPIDDAFQQDGPTDAQTPFDPGAEFGTRGLDDVAPPPGASPDDLAGEAGTAPDLNSPTAPSSTDHLSPSGSPDLRGAAAPGADPRAGAWTGSQSWSDQSSSDGGTDVTGHERYEDDTHVMTVDTSHSGGVTRQTVTHTDKATGETTTETSTQGTPPPQPDPEPDPQPDPEPTPDSTPDPDGAMPGTIGDGDLPPGPVDDPWDEPLDLVDSMSQPSGDDAGSDGREPAPLTLEQAMEGDVDPYALWTDEHVDVGDATIDLGRADDTLIDPEEFVTGGFDPAPEPDGIPDSHLDD